jgi:hypothetical protein
VRFWSSPQAKATRRVSAVAGGGGANLVWLSRRQPPRRVGPYIRLKMKMCEDTRMHHALRLHSVEPEGLGQLHGRPHRSQRVPFQCSDGKGQQPCFARAPIPLRDAR